MFTKYTSFRLRANTMSPYLPAHCPYAYYHYVYIRVSALARASYTYVRVYARVCACIIWKTMRRLLTMPSRHNRVQHVLFVRRARARVCVKKLAGFFLFEKKLKVNNYIYCRRGAKYNNTSGHWRLLLFEVEKTKLNRRRL